MFSKLLSYSVFNGTKSDLINLIEKYDKLSIVSGNPEVLYSGLKSAQLFSWFNSEKTVIIPDGIGTVLSLKSIGQPVSEKIAGIEVLDQVIRMCLDKGESIYLVGTDQETLEKCVDNIKKRYTGIKIAGYHNGYFDMENCGELIADIKDSKPYALFAAMGCPRQEKFIYSFMDELPCKVYMGVGGSFDVFAGKLKRAPRWMIKLGMEWLYRVIKEPFRIKRLFLIPKFLLKVIYCTYIIKE